MDTEENVLLFSYETDPEIFLLTTRKQARKWRRKRQLTANIKVMVGGVTCVVAIIMTTVWLLASRDRLSYSLERPVALIVLAAIGGAVLIVGSVVATVRLIVVVVTNTYYDIDFTSKITRIVGYMRMIVYMVATLGVSVYAALTAIVIYLMLMFYR